MTKVIKGKDLQEGIRRKVDVVPTYGGGVVGRRVLSAQEKAEKILASAEREASRIQEEAAAILSRVDLEREEARRQGYADGESKGLAQVSEQLVRLHALKEKFYAEAEKEIIKLVMAIAEKVIGQIVNDHPKVIRQIVTQALEHSLGDRITVRVNPADYATITAGDSEFRDTLDRTKRLVFREDELVEKGGCVVETEVGTIDAQIEPQLEAIRKALNG